MKQSKSKKAKKSAAGTNMTRKFDSFEELGLSLERERQERPLRAINNEQKRAAPHGKGTEKQKLMDALARDGMRRLGLKESAGGCFLGSRKSGRVYTS